GETRACEAVGAYVQVMTGVAAHPVPAHAMVRERRIETFPQVVVLDRLAIGRAPAVALPFLDPRHDAVAQILAVGVDVDEARALERLDGRDRRHQLHPVVGGGGLAALDLFFVDAGDEDRAPAARTRIP